MTAAQAASALRGLCPLRRHGFDAAADADRRD
jgi:hypothetical protein